jgi:tRNA dimethylallyltransferase
MSQERPILIAGPTASGKSKLALELAERHGGVIINADSMQVYRELSVLTARPTSEETAQVPHRLYGHVAASDAYSVGRWIADVAVALDEARASGRRPIIVGGTGLYFKALLEGLSPIPLIPEAVRAHWRAEAQRLGPAELHAVLAAKDAVMAARLRPTDPQRVTRALEVLEATGRSLDHWQRQPGQPLLDPDNTDRLVVTMDREALYARCDRRFEVMLGTGALDEVRTLAALGLDAQLPAMRAIGVRPLLLLLAGQIGRDEAVAQAQAETRQYVKRQLTWIKSNMSAWKCL